MQPRGLTDTVARRLPLFVIALLVSLFAAIPAMAKPGDKVLNRPYADQKRIHLGFSVGMHFQDISFTHNGFLTDDGQKWVASTPNISPGFCVNVMADLRLHKHLNLRFSPGMYFGQKSVEMIDYNSALNGIGSATNVRKQEVKSSYVVLPLDLKVSGVRYHNARPYVSAGVMGTFDVSKQRSEALMFNRGDAYLTLGIGCDFYLPFFKFIPEIKFCFGLTDILKHDRPDLVDDPETFKMTQSLQKVKGNMVVINFYFE